MARRKKTRPAENLVDPVAMLTWWAGVGLALVSHLLLHGVASLSVLAPTQPGQMDAKLTQAHEQMCFCHFAHFWGCTGYPACRGTWPIG